MPPISPVAAAARAQSKQRAANNNETSGELKYRISWVTGGFMTAVAILFDGVQILLTLLVLPALGSYLIDFVYVIVFPLWFTLLNVELLGGRNAGMKMASAFGGAIIEFVPVVDALPAITVSVLSIIVASRMEDRMKHAAQKDRPVVNSARFFPRTVKIPRAANDVAPAAANNTEEDMREAA